MDTYQQVCCLFLNGFVSGILAIYLGPSLTDLQLLTRATQRQAGILLLAQNVAAIVFQPFCLWSNKYWNPYGTLLFSRLFIGVGFFCLGFSTKIYLTATIVFLMAGLDEIAYSVVLYRVHLTWPEKSSMIHLLYALSSLGSTMTPLLISEFLQDGSITLIYRHYLDERNLHVCFGCSINASDIDDQKSEKNFANPENVVSLVQYPLIVCGSIALFACSANIFLLVTVNWRKYQNNATLINLGKYQPGRVNSCLAFVFLSLAQGLPILFGSVGPTFGFHSALHVQLQEMALILTVFSVAITVGRGLGLVASRLISEAHITMACICGMAVGIAMLGGSLLRYKTLLWCSSVVLGLFAGPLLTAALAWMYTTFVITPSMNALFTVAFSTASSWSFICHLLMTFLGPNTFVYCISTYCCCFSFLYIYLHSSITSDINHNINKD